MRTAVEDHPAGYFRGILQIVNCIYAAVSGEISWEETFAEVCRVGKLDGCALSLIEPLARRRVVAASYGLSVAAEPDALLGPIPGDAQLTDSVLQSSPGAIWQVRQIKSDALPPTAKSFWTDRMQPGGSIAWACVVVGRDDREAVCLEVYAGPGRASSCPELGDFLRQLAPHLTRAWRLDRTSRSGAASRPESPARSTPAPDLAGLPEVARLRAEFGLTKAEARLALRLAEGSSLASAAEAFGVKLTTIRSQLQQVFAKTGTSRQMELVAMILSRGYGTGGPLWTAVKRERQPTARAGPGS